MINFQSSGKRTLKNLAAGKLKIDVLDCTLANGSVTPTIPGINWIPIKPATNAAFCAALVQKIIADKTYNADAISFTTQKAAVEGGYGAYTNATYLVIVDENHPNYRKLMRAADAGIDAPEEKDKDGKAVEQYVVIDAATGQPALHSACSKGTLEYEGEVNGVKVRTGFSLLTETVNEYTMDEYAEITGVSVEDLERIAKEYTSHGTRVGICHKGGSAASVNGIDTVMGAAVLHAIVGANQMIGGNAPNSPAPTTAGNGARYKLGAIEGKPDVSTKNACYISRTVKAWEKTDEYKNRVAAGEKDPKPLMPWFANGAASDSQALLSIVNKYPYQAKILTSFMCNTIQATPGAMRDEVVERLCDPEVLPLHIVCDVFVGEHAQYADYIVPDVTPYESFGLPTTGTTFTGYGTTVRWQVKEPELGNLPGRRGRGVRAARMGRGRHQGRGRQGVAAARRRRLLSEGGCEPGLRRGAGGRHRRAGSAAPGPRRAARQLQGSRVRRGVAQGAERAVARRALLAHVLRARRRRPSQPRVQGREPGIFLQRETRDEQELLLG